MACHPSNPSERVVLTRRTEPFNDDGTFRSDVFFNTLGESYIATALKTAKSADPNAKVYINDFNIEGTGLRVSPVPISRYH